MPRGNTCGMMPGRSGGLCGIWARSLGIEPRTADLHVSSFSALRYPRESMEAQQEKLATSCKGAWWAAPRFEPKAKQWPEFVSGGNFLLSTPFPVCNKRRLWTALWEATRQAKILHHPQRQGALGGRRGSPQPPVWRETKGHRWHPPPNPMSLVQL